MLRSSHNKAANKGTDNAAMLALLDAQPMTGTQAMLHIVEQMQHPQPKQLVAFGSSLLKQLQEQDIILGTES
jgi:hypothetical protein